MAETSAPAEAAAEHPRQRSFSRILLPRRWGVRVQATVATALLVFLVVAFTGLLLLQILSLTMLGAADDKAKTEHQEVLRSLQVTENVPWSQSILVTIQAAEQANKTDSTGVVITQNGERYSTNAKVGSFPESLSWLDPEQTESSAGQQSGLLPTLKPYTYYSTGIVWRGQQYTVGTVLSLKEQRRTLNTVTVFIAAGVPILMVCGAATMWVLIGEALGPVNRLSRQVQKINAANLDERVDVPPTQDEIAALAVTMNGMLDRLQAADRAQRQFVADASHELRSPLATLTTTIEVAQGDPSGATWLEVGPTLRTQSHRMGRLVSDLLTLAKVDEAGLQLRVADTDLDEVVAEEIARLRPAVEVELRAHVEPVRVRGDAGRLQQVLRNLLSNAQRHAENWIAVGLTTEGEQAVVTVTDDGPGIPPEQRERVFERFVRLDDSRARDTGGSGLGLPISRVIAAAHGGTLVAGEDAQGRTRFEMRLPLPPED